MNGEPTHLVWPVLVGYLVYGLFVGPILGYIFDFHNRVTISKERGSAILILGLNLGSSLVPFLFTSCLKLGLKGASMPVVQMLSIITPWLLMCYMSKVNSAVIHGTADSLQIEMDKIPDTSLNPGNDCTPPELITGERTDGNIA